MVASAGNKMCAFVPPARPAQPTGLAALPARSASPALSPFPDFSAWLVALASCVLLSACGGRAAPAAAPPPPAPPIINIMPPPAAPPVRPVNVVLFGSSGINPGLNERPSPVLVRVYELKTVTAFDAADYFALADKDRELLGADLLGRDDYQIKPGERLQVARTLNTATKRLAAMVSFRDLERSVWKASVAISDPPPDEIRILIDARRVQVLVQ